jgi:uncharacterized membrane protein YdjX (TVP38/TMEM64 family)
LPQFFAQPFTFFVWLFCLFFTFFPPFLVATAHQGYSFTPSKGKCNST